MNIPAKRFGSLVVFSLLSMGLASAQSRSETGVRILLGVTDTQSKTWDGSLSVRGGRLEKLEPWRFDGQDSISGSGWKISTHAAELFLGGIFYAAPASPIVPNGVVAQLSGTAEDSEIQVKTAQGDFEFRLSQIPFGSALNLLNGAVTVDRIPAFTQITSSPEEQDYPAAIRGKDNDMWLAYVEFHHAKNHNQLRADVKQPISDLQALASPTGGDQVFARHFSGGSWGEPIAVTDAGLDLYKTAIAQDGSGKVWVFWSENQGGNFDIWARSLDQGKPGARVRISRAEGSDIQPAATTDSNGQVWVAWQGWREGKAAIFSARQQGGGFSAPATVSAPSTGNEWDPAVAADGTGRVTVAWDSYRNGNYDIYMRTADSGGRWGAEVPVAKTPRYEAYPSIAYDSSGRVWVAYEEGGAGWGKDFGAYNTTGVAVYQGRLIRLRGFEPSGQVVETAGDLGAVLPGWASTPNEPWNTQNDAQDLDDHQDLAKTRRASVSAANMKTAHNNYPRLSIDSSGRMWLAYRNLYPVWWSPLGTSWFEYVVSYDGGAWTKPIFVGHSDNLLDNRPALVSPSPGSLTLVGSSDHRGNYQLAGKYVIGLDKSYAHSLLGERTVQESFPLYLDPSIPNDPYNNDLFANTLTLGPGGTIQVKPATGPVAAAAAEPPGMSSPEKAAQSLRAFRSADGYKILRGEFHRHSEISMDGAWDGSTVDQYRYMIDAASMDWVGCCDHDNGDGREYSWWISQKLTDVFHSPTFVPMFSYERSIPYPEGHRNMIFAQRGVRTLPRLPITTEDYKGHAPDTQMLYAYLKHFDGVTAAHTSATSMGTDWRDNDPDREPVVEIYQGDRQNYEMPDSPRTSSSNDSIGGWKPKGFVNVALQKGYKLGFQSSSDHVSTHMSYCNLILKDNSRASILDAFKKRHVYGATDDILAQVRSGKYMMGDVFSTSTPPSISVHLQGTAPFAKVVVIKDNNYVYSAAPGTAEVKFTWRDNAAVPGKTSYYYVRGEQANGEIVWASPMWITYAQK